MTGTTAPRARLLLVDDEPSFLDVMARRLSGRGYDVITADSGNDALSALERSGDREVVVMDVLMPGMDGVQALEAIKERTPLVQVVLLTGHATVETAVEGIKQGAFDYLMKPCDFDELMAKIDKAAAVFGDLTERMREIRMRPYASEEEKHALVEELLAEAGAARRASS